MYVRLFYNTYYQHKNFLKNKTQTFFKKKFLLSVVLFKIKFEKDFLEVQTYNIKIIL